MIWSGGIIYMDLQESVLGMVRESKLFDFYYRYIWRPEESTIQSKIYEYAEEYEDFFFIQVGANDGYTNDPIHKFIRMFDWEGILIEPQKRVFEEELKDTYSGNNKLELVNAAIDSECGTKEMYKVGFSESKWATGLSSLQKEMIEKQVSRGYVEEKAELHNEEVPDSTDELISTETVRKVTFDMLFEKYDIHKVDGLFIDTEGYDGKVMELYDFENYPPKLVLFEHQHLTPEEILKWNRTLRGMGYSLMEGEYNTLAYA